MGNFLLADGNMPFTLAITVMLAFGIIETLGMLFGLGISDAIDTLLPDFDADVDGAQGATTLTALLGWLRIGQVPLLILLVVFLTAFGVIGLTTQYAAQTISGHFLPTWIAVIPAVFFALPPVRYFGALFSRFIPKVETEAVSTDTFIGKIAKITLGTAKQGYPAEAKLSDKFHTVHYVMVEPDVADEFEQGTQVLLVKKIREGLFSAIRNTNENLVNK